jgi:G3E family GTPase
MAETGRGTGIALQAVVTTIDAVNGLATLARELQSVRQVAAADLLLLTKTDLLAEGPDRALLDRISALNPQAPLLPVNRGEIEPAQLLGIGFDWERALGEGAEGGSGRLPPTQASPTPHNPDITCLTIRLTKPVPALALTLLLEALADHIGADLLRLKAIVNVAERPERPAVLHGVQHVFHEPQWLERWPTADRATRLVLIGRGLSRLWVEALLGALIAEVTEVGG